MKYLGIDFGERRIGLAVSDEEGRLAFPRLVLNNDKFLWTKIVDLCEQEKIQVIILGESKNFQGQDNAIMPQIRILGERLRTELEKEVIYEPEFMTSQQASQITGENKMLDASAAALILQSYLNRRKI
jgi:putative Holliday junction resolvase